MESFIVLVSWCAVLALLAVLVMMFIIYRSIRRMRREMIRQLSQQVVTEFQNNIESAVSDEQKSQRIHGFELKAIAPATGLTVSRKTKSIRVKTVAQKKRERMLRNVPAIAKMGADEVISYLKGQ